MKQSTIRHAVAYLREVGPDKSLRQLDPGVPCAAFGLARSTLAKCGSAVSAAVYLECQLYLGMNHE